ncbi:MAG TPA: Clp protease N-terminal domain-containing protein, partial [Myxococcales bacterium]
MADRDEVQGRLCDIDHRRPATIRVTVIENGQRRTLNVCREHYEQLRARQASPFESLFGGFSGGPGDDLLGSFFGEKGQGRDREEIGGPVGGTPRPRRGGGRPRGAARGRESVDLTEYMSGQAEEILQQAARTAAEWGSREVDSEHLLFALADNDVVQAILNRFKLSPEELKSQVREVSPKRERKGDGPQGGIGVSPRVKAALLSAFNASRDLGHSYLGPEHLLIGLAEEEDSLARNLLSRYGLTPEALRQQTVRVVGKGAEEGRVEGKSETPNLDKYSRDLTALAKQGKLDPVIGRAQEIETVIEILSRRKKNNPVLIGEPGVGKTAIVEGLAQRMLAGEVPEPLRGKRVVELLVNSI